MKKWIMILALVVFLGANLTPAIAGNGDPAGPSGPAGPAGPSGPAGPAGPGGPGGPEGPAPNSGDGVPDGSGLDGHHGNNAASEGPGIGPAPNSGDGDPDGSGF